MIYFIVRLLVGEVSVMGGGITKGKACLGLVAGLVEAWAMAAGAREEVTLSLIHI